jgi:hypothetical protein
MPERARSDRPEPPADDERSCSTGAKRGERPKGSVATRHARWYAGCWQRVPADSAGRRVLASARVVDARFARSGRPGRVGADAVRSTPRKRGGAGILTTWHDRAILRVRSRRVVVGPSRKSAWVSRQLAPDPAATCWISRSGRNGARIVHQPDRREPGRGVNRGTGGSRAGTREARRDRFCSVRSSLSLLRFLAFLPA